MQNVFFNETPQKISFDDYYSYFSTGVSVDFPYGVSVKAVATRALDLDGDGKLEIVTHLWAGILDLGQKTDISTPNRLIILSQNDQEIYIDRTSDFIVGDTVLTGASRNIAFADVNGDGRLDWIYALNREDGRALVPYGSAWAQTVVALSAPGGKYELVNIGAADHFHAAGVIENGTGTLPTFVAVGYQHVGQSFYFSDGKLVEGAAAPFSPDTFAPLSSGDRAFTDYVITEVMQDNGATLRGSLALHQRDGSEWKVVDTMIFETRDVWATSWNGEAGWTKAAVVDGKLVLDNAFYESKVADLGLPSEVAILKLSGYLPADPNHPDERNGVNFNKLMFYTVENGKLVDARFKIVGEQTDINANFFDVLDVNRDGHQDIVVYPYTDTGEPILYLNDGAGTFTNTPGVFRGTTNTKPLLTSLASDFDGDGALDLLVYPGTNWPSGEKGAPWELYESLANVYTGPDQTNPALRGAAGFNEQFYLNQNLDVAAAVSVGAFKSGLDHYLAFGRVEGRAAFASNTQVWGSETGETISLLGGNETIRAGAGNDILIGRGGDDELDGGAGIDAAIYTGGRADYRIEVSGNRATVTDLREIDGSDSLVGIEVIVFKDRTIFTTRLTVDQLFNAAWYLARNSDVAAAGMDPGQHFQQYGWKEGRDPSPWFDTSAYLSANPDVASAAINPLDHAVLYGIGEGRLIAPSDMWLFPS